MKKRNKILIDNLKKIERFKHINFDKPKYPNNYWDDLKTLLKKVKSHDDPSKLKTKSFSIGNIIPQLRELVKTKWANYILDVLYYSLSHELSAQIHQYYLHKMNKKEYKRIYDIKHFIENFKVVKLNRDEESDIILIKNI